MRYFIDEDDALRDAGPDGLRDDAAVAREILGLIGRDDLRRRMQRIAPPGRLRGTAPF